MKRLGRSFIALLFCLSVLLPPATAEAQAAPYVSPETGFAVADTAQGNFLSEFRRLGGVDVLGFPVSQPFAAGEFNYQAFQRAVLQWRPEANQAFLANTMDWLSDAGKDPFLAALGIPMPLRDAGGSWQQVVAERESWLTEPSIAIAYRRGGGYNLYGLPASRPERAGPFVVQRFQRYVFQLWVEAVPGMPSAGSVVGVLAGDLLRQAGLVPAAVTTPAPAVAVGACVSNSQSVVKSADIDVVRYRFVTLVGGGTGLELTLRNNCNESRHIFFSARLSPTPEGPPVVTGSEQGADFGPNEEKQQVYSWRAADGTYPEVNSAWSVTFRWNWQRQGDDGQPVCLDVGAERCLNIDPRLRSTLQDLSTVPVASDLLRKAATNRVVVRRGDLTRSVLGTYFRATRAVTLTTRLDAYTEFERGSVLTHELRHAADQFDGVVINSTQTCLAAEERAFRVSSDVWFTRWGGNLPPASAGTLRWRINEIAREALATNGELSQTVLDLYGDTCQ
ncbi:MAG: DUF6782 family putative metallopeptidase [Chloroflexota bacterium]